MEENFTQLQQVERTLSVSDKVGDESLVPSCTTDDPRMMIIGTAPQTEIIDTKALKVNASQEYVDASTPVFKDVEVQPFSLTPGTTLQTLAEESDKELERLEGLERQVKFLKRGEANIFKRRLLKIWEAMNVRFEAGEKLILEEDGEKHIFEGTGGKGLGSYLRWNGINPQDRRNWLCYLKKKEVARLTGTVLPDPKPKSKSVTIEGEGPINEIAKYGLRMAQTLSDPNFEPMLSPQDRLNKAGAMGTEMLEAVRENSLDELEVPTSDPAQVEHYTDQLVDLDQRLHVQLKRDFHTDPLALEVVAELKAQLEGEPDTTVGTRLLTEYVSTLCAQFNSDKIKVESAYVSVKFNGREGRMLPGDWLRYEKTGAGTKVSGTLRLAKCTKIAEFMQRRKYQLFDKGWQKEKTMGFKGYEERDFTVISEDAARVVCPEAFAPPETPKYEPPAQQEPGKWVGSDSRNINRVVPLNESKDKFEAAFATFDMANVQVLLDSPTVDGKPVHKKAISLAEKRLARVRAANIVPMPHLMPGGNEVDDRKRGYCPACGKKIPCKKGILNDHWSSSGFKDCSGSGARAAMKKRM